MYIPRGCVLHRALKKSGTNVVNFHRFLTKRIPRPKTMSSAKYDKFLPIELPLKFGDGGQHRLIKAWTEQYRTSVRFRHLILGKILY